MKKLKIATELLKNEASKSSFTKELLYRYKCNYEKIQNAIYPIDNYEYAGEHDQMMLQNLNSCLNLIEHESLNFEGWMLFTIYSSSDFTFVNKIKKQAFDLMLDETNEPIPCYLDNFRIIEAKSIRDAINNYDYTTYFADLNKEGESNEKRYSNN